MNKKKNPKNKYHARHKAGIVKSKALKGKKQVLTGDNPLLDSYFKDLSKYEILTRERERELVTQFRKWRDNSRAGEGTRKNGEIARELLIGSVLRLVIKIANEYSHCSMSLEDLVNEGNIGLMTAVEKFDPERKVRLSTYASYWIRQGIHRSLENQSRTIRLPAHTYPMVKKINKFINEYKEKNGETPTPRQIVSGTKVSEANVINLFTSGVNNVVSLDIPVGDESSNTESTLQDITEDFNTEQPSTSAEKDDEAAILHDFLSRLSSRERIVIMRRFGMKGLDLETLEEIGERYGVTRERIRQIQTIAMRKLRNFSRHTFQKTWADFVG